jgi:imidazolonepropionase-like amidohydrolase
MQSCRAVVLIAVGLLLARCGRIPAGRSIRRLGRRRSSGGRVHPGPDAPVVPDGVVLFRAGLIAAVGPRSEVSVPLGADVIDCAGATVTAGFWNSHVHFTQPVWSDAATAPAARFGAAAKTGRLAPGMIADVVVLDGNPDQDIRALAKVRYTVRGGRIIYRRAS